jgi:hypothetical protein
MQKMMGMQRIAVSFINQDDTLDDLPGKLYFSSLYKTHFGETGREFASDNCRTKNGYRLPKNPSRRMREMPPLAAK